MLGGSNAYGLQTPQSDLDYRGVYLYEKSSEIIGLDRFPDTVDKKEENDEFYYEFRHFLTMLRKSSTHAMELLFNTQWIEVDPRFEALHLQKDKLIDSERMYKSLKGYLQNERRLANGERTGDLGGKRKASLDLYGFSPRNFVHILRLNFCATVFFKKGYYPVNIRNECSDFADSLVTLKTQPESFTKETLNDMADIFEQKTDTAFSNRAYSYKFDNDFANRLCLEFYLPILNNEYANFPPIL